MGRAARRAKRLRSKLEKTGIIPETVVSGNMIDRMTALTKAAGGHVESKPHDNINGNFSHSSGHDDGWRKDKDGVWKWIGKGYVNSNNGNGNSNHNGMGFTPNYLHPTQPPNIPDTGYRKLETDNHTFHSQDIIKEYGKDDNKLSACHSDDLTATCPIENCPEVYMPKSMYNSWIELAGEYDKEWLAYLTGKYEAAYPNSKGVMQPPRWVIDGFYFPPLVATGAHVDVDPDFTKYRPNTMGAVHSHVKMGVFFSGEDLKHSNWNVEIVVNAHNQSKTMIRHKLECGKFAKSYSKIWLTSAVTKESKELDKAFQEGERLRQARLNRPSKPAIAADSSQLAEATVDIEITETSVIVTKGELTTASPSPASDNNKNTNNNIPSGISIDDQTGQVIENGIIVGVVDGTGSVITGDRDLQAKVDNMLDNDFPDCMTCDGKGWINQQECPVCHGIGWTRKEDGIIIDDGSMLYS